MISEMLLPLASLLNFQKLADLEARLVSLDSGDVDVVRSTIEEFSEKVDLDKDSILNK